MNHNPQKIPRVSPYEIWYNFERSKSLETGRMLSTAVRKDNVMTESSFYLFRGRPAVAS